MDKKLLELLQSFSPTDVNNQFSRDLLTVDPNRGIEGLPVHKSYKQEKFPPTDVQNEFSKKTLTPQFPGQPGPQDFLLSPMRNGGNFESDLPAEENQLPPLPKRTQQAAAPMPVSQPMAEAPAAPSSSGGVQDFLSKLLNPRDEELEKALQKRQQDQNMLMIARGAEKIGSGILGVESDKDYLQGYMNLAEQGVKDIERAREGAEKKARFAVDMDKAVKQMQDEDARRDSKSEISKLGKAAITDMLGKIGRQDMASQLQNSNLSLKQLEDVYGQLNIQNYISMYEAQQNRLEAAKMAKEQRSESKSEEEKRRLTTHISDKIKQYDDKVGYSKTASDYQMLKGFLESGTFNSVADIMATYSLMKALDPTSVVRESEFDTLVRAPGGFEKIVRSPQRFFKGDIYSPKFRKELVDKYSKIVETRKKQFERVVGPDLKRAKDLGINREYLLTDSFEQQPVESSIFDSNKAAEELAKRKGK